MLLSYLNPPALPTAGKSMTESEPQGQTPSWGRPIGSTHLSL